MADVRITTDHQQIRQWIQARGGHPARVRGTAVSGSSGVLLIDYGDAVTEQPEQITWDDFFQGFEENDLAFLYPDDTDETRLAKLVSRESRGEGTRAAS